MLLKNSNNEIVSASEDGEVKIWGLSKIKFFKFDRIYLFLDLRSNQNCISIKPFENAVIYFKTKSWE